LLIFCATKKVIAKNSHQCLGFFFCIIIIFKKNLSANDHRHNLNDWFRVGLEVVGEGALWKKVLEATDGSLPEI
jgi:hypothetical protein